MQVILPDTNITASNQGTRCYQGLADSQDANANVASGLLSWGHLISSDYRKFDFTDTI